MAGNGYGDFSPPREENPEDDALPRPLSVEHADETSDVSASLFKEMTSEEEMEEVASGIQNQIRIGKDGNLNNEVGDGDTDGDSSGEEGSLFEDIDGEDESQYAGLRGVHQSGYGGTLNRGAGASHEIYVLGGGISEEVPFISTGGKDLDGPYDGSLPPNLGLLPRKADVTLDNLESKVDRVKDESSLLSGIGRDYGTSSGEEGGEDGALVRLADANLEDGRNSTVPVPEDSLNQPQEGFGPGRVSPMAFGRDRTLGEDKAMPSSLGQLSEAPDSYEALDGQDKTLNTNSPKERVRKRGRATRELGALLMDSNAGRRGKRAFELQGACALASGQGTAGESGDGFAASDGFVKPFMGPGSTSDVRITRSQVSGRSGLKDDNLDSKVPEVRGIADVSAKRTGKRSVTRSRLGWGNANDSSQQSPEVAGKGEGKSSATGEAVDDVQQVADVVLGVVHVDEEPTKSKPKGKSGGRVTKARAPGKAGCADALAEGQADLREILPSSPLRSRAEDLDGSEMLMNYDKVVCPLPSVECGLQDAVCSLNSQETEMDAVMENSLGRRRSNRHAAKIGEKVEVGQPAIANGKLPKHSKGRKRASSSKGKKSEEVSVLKLVEKQNSEIEEENSESFVTPEETTIEVLEDSENLARKSKGSPANRKSSEVSFRKKKKNSSCVLRASSMDKVNLKSELELVPLLPSKQEGAGVKDISLIGDDKNTSSITGDTKDSCQDTKGKKHAAKITSGSRDVRRSQVFGRGLDIKDDEDLRNTETCTSSACVDLPEQVSKVGNKTMRGSRSLVKLDSVSCDEDADLRRAGGSQDRVAECGLDPSRKDDGENLEGDNCRDFREDVGSATSCDSLVKKEGEVGDMNQGFAPDTSLPGSGGCGDPDKTEMGDLANQPELTGSGKARTRQRRATHQQEGAQLGTQTSRKGKKGGRKKDILGSTGLGVSSEKDVNLVSKRKSKGREKRGSVLDASDKNGPDFIKEMAVNKQVGEVTFVACAMNAVESVSHNEELENVHGEQAFIKEEGNFTSLGLDIEVSKRRKMGNSVKASAVELATDKTKVSAESSLAGGAKSSRCANSVQKKPKKSIVSSSEATASGTKIKSESNRPSRAKGMVIKALSSIKDQTGDKAAVSSQDELVNPVNGSHMAHSEGLSLKFTGVDEVGGSVETRPLDDADAARGREEVKDSSNIICGQSSQDLDNFDSPEDTGAVGEDMSSGVTEGDANENERTEAGVADVGIPRKSWVLCDDCNKWRCIPVELADQIDDTNAKWSCRDNPNPDYADCSIPQEKSNAEINEELQISEVSVTEEGDDKDGIDSKLMEIGSGSGDNKPAVWKLIRRNIFHHRRTKAQGSDEIMVCQCTPPEDGGVGCGDNCLNRVLNIECVQEHCPCGEACSNQQFQKRMYAPVATFRCGKKGFGLKVLKYTPKDSFLIEYVGEVLDVGAFEERQQDYARNGQKHFYFMTLSSTEVIDACSKGNFGRFINHSCEPNCKTEKWMVNGEVCIGLFAIRDIAEGEEVTFDYNYVRVRGASAKKCECGSSQCRGFIGADSETPRAVVESDSEDDEDPEPIMIVNSDEEDNHVDESKVTPLKKIKDDFAYRETTSTRPSRIKRKLVPVKDKVPVAVKRIKTSSTSRKSSISNPKGLTVDVGRHEGARALSSDVQEKLDDLLDKRGGLKKRKDVAAQYLKLLVLQYASGDNKKDAAACSVRDISLLLEALLRTSSRSVLSDIMKMNGLRMLHHFIKQLRKQWDKTPILRKLMKVLELLASDRVRVLTENMINSAPPCQGMESFSESLFELTRHRDPEVCHMARRFRNRWIPPRPQIYEQQNKGPEKSPQLYLKSGSPARMLSSSQMQLDSSQFSSPQKQSPTSVALKGAEASKVVSGSSASNGSQGITFSTQSKVGTLPTDESTALKPAQGEVSMQNGPHTETGKDEKVKRKRVSRWDAPAKVEKGTYEPIVAASAADVPVADSSLPSRQTSVPSAPQTQAASAQPQFQGSSREISKKQRQFGPNHENVNRGVPYRYEAPVGKQGSEEMLGTSSGQPTNIPPQHAWQSTYPGAPPSWPSTSTSGGQDPARLPFGVTSGQPQLHPGCTPGVPQRRPEPGYGIPAQPHAPGPLSVPPAMQMNGPLMIPTGPVPLHLGPQQVPLTNPGPPHGGVPLPGTTYPGCPPAHMGLGGPPHQLLHGMTPNMPNGYPQGVHYGPWGPAPVMPHFAGPPAFPMDESRRFLPQATWLPNSSIYNEDVSSQRTSVSGEILPSNGDLPPNGVQSAGDVEPEPPVPGLSPPTTSSTHDLATSTNPCPRELCQEQKMPPEFLDPRRCGESFIANEVPDTRRDRDHGPEYYRAGISDMGCGFQEEHWDDPESQSFRDHVFFLVKSRVRRHKLKTRDIDKFCTKLADVIVRKEVAKCLEHRNQGSEKIIVRSKLAEKVESYVDNQVEQFSRKCDRSYKSGDTARIIIPPVRSTSEPNLEILLEVLYCRRGLMW
ncbi:protein MpASHH3 [Marchantia polymorpha subsp. ruderalis]|uniref:Histone-lysine N-methyltransferase n=2 Tax=Marchantia polymorpha TaxID=3197 RepID=A0A2R6W137_MARPO|nr:hypothetical protein MARPO_0192s0005 [Marchantia polymorpha]BBN20370.1 hypothetical protein Mp_8g18560 [Marchantia polymorpha subsp. ruderalis]|eukprot:PTQ27569.1 hypothetical protein MARPO_0192s0005 [Marchantia polymorpha]